MKLFLFSVTCLLSFNSFAFNICDYEDTATVSDAIEAKKIIKTKTVSEHSAFSNVEKKMILMALKTDSLNAEIDEEEALRLFNDDVDAGEIEYLTAENTKFALVHYWPGENEYGAFIEIKNNKSIKVIAAITDGFIECK